MILRKLNTRFNLYGNKFHKSLHMFFHLQICKLKYKLKDGAAAYFPQSKIKCKTNRYI